MTTTIDIAKDFARFPRGRYPADGDGNATSFRKKFLLPVLEKDDRATIVLDGTGGYASSFLDEAFGGLVRKEGYSAKKVLSTFEFRAEELGFRRFVDLIRMYVERAAEEKNKSESKG